MRSRWARWVAQRVPPIWRWIVKSGASRAPRGPERAPRRHASRIGRGPRFDPFEFGPADPTSAADDPTTLSLFEPATDQPDGFCYRPDLLEAGEERALVSEIGVLPFKAFEFHGFEGRRRVVSFGWRYDFNDGMLRPVEEIPPFLQGVREKAARFAGVEAAALSTVS